MVSFLTTRIITFINFKYICKKAYTYTMYIIAYISVVLREICGKYFVIIKFYVDGKIGDALCIHKRFIYEKSQHPYILVGVRRRNV